MPKRVFWPVALLVMGLVFLAQNMGYFPAAFWNLWPLMLIVVGLGGLITSDTDRWMYNSKSTTAPKAKRSVVAAKPAKATKPKAKSRK
jgi:hypothetical protein